jgi:hypothetical protein
VSLLPTVVLTGVALALLGLIVLLPLRAVRQDRELVAEERGWMSAGRFPASVERLYRNSRLLLTDGPRLRALGYTVVERRPVRMGLGRPLWVRWRATEPPAAGGEAAAGPPPEAPSLRPPAG